MPPEESQLESLQGSVPRFRVIRVGESRRGIRLEQIFWTTLTELAESRCVTVGRILQECEERSEGKGNISSAMRVKAMRFLRRELDLARSRVEHAQSQIQACPTPCFALSSSKQIMAHNQAFSAFVRFHLARRVPAGSARQRINLSLDVPYAQLVTRLKIPGAGHTLINFALSIDTQVIRGRLNTALAPMFGKDAIIGYILPSSS